MRYKLVGNDTTVVMGKTAFISSMKRKGYKNLGENSNSAQREELQGQPRFKGLVGPMWDNDCVRYETPEMNDILSR